eukprot:m.9436 g.9436  ORF g.9436 m.9436 type:complete len:1451 (+) comp2406_c0_seq1:76-4428(+)
MDAQDKAEFFGSLLPETVASMNTLLALAPPLAEEGFPTPLYDGRLLCQLMNLYLKRRGHGSIPLKKDLSDDPHFNLRLYTMAVSRMSFSPTFLFEPKDVQSGSCDEAIVHGAWFLCRHLSGKPTLAPRTAASLKTHPAGPPRPAGRPPARKLPGPPGKPPGARPVPMPRTASAAAVAPGSPAAPAAAAQPAAAPRPQSAARQAKPLPRGRPVKTSPTKPAGFASKTGSKAGSAVSVLPSKPGSRTNLKRDSLGGSTPSLVDASLHGSELALNIPQSAASGSDSETRPGSAPVDARHVDSAASDDSRVVPARLSPATSRIPRMSPTLRPAQAIHSPRISPLMSPTANSTTPSGIPRTNTSPGNAASSSVAAPSASLLGSASPAAQPRSAASSGRASPAVVVPRPIMFPGRASPGRASPGRMSPAIVVPVPQGPNGVISRVPSGPSLPVVSSGTASPLSHTSATGGSPRASPVPRLSTNAMRSMGGSHSAHTSPLVPRSATHTGIDVSPVHNTSVDDSHLPPRAHSRITLGSSPRTPSGSTEASRRNTPLMHSHGSTPRSSKESTELRTSRRQSNVSGEPSPGSGAHSRRQTGSPVKPVPAPRASIKSPPSAAKPMPTLVRNESTRPLHAAARALPAQHIRSNTPPSTLAAPADTPGAIRATTPVSLPPSSEPATPLESKSPLDGPLTPKGPTTMTQEQITAFVADIVPRLREALPLQPHKVMLKRYNCLRGQDILDFVVKAGAVGPDGDAVCVNMVTNRILTRLPFDMGGFSKTGFFRWGDERTPSVPSTPLQSEPSTPHGHELTPLTPTAAMTCAACAKPVRQTLLSKPAVICRRCRQVFHTKCTVATPCEKPVKAATPEADTTLTFSEKINVTLDSADAVPDEELYTDRESDGSDSDSADDATDDGRPGTDSATAPVPGSMHVSICEDDGLDGPNGDNSVVSDEESIASSDMRVAPNRPRQHGGSVREVLRGHGVPVITRGAPIVVSGIKAVVQLWRDRPDVVASGVLGTLSRAEITRQEAIAELVTSEAAYAADVKVLVLWFLLPLEAHARHCDFKHVRPPIRREVIKALLERAQDLQKLSADVLAQFQRRQEEAPIVATISDILTGLSGVIRDSFTAYCEMAIEAQPEIDERLAELSQFFEQHCQDPATRKLPFNAFLLAPVQRLSRYPLLIKAIRDATPLDHADIAPITTLHTAYVSLVQQCNDKLHVVEDRVQLVQIEASLDCIRLKDPIRLTDGPRSLVRRGPVQLLTVAPGTRKVTKTKTVELMLFTDLFIYAKPVSTKGWKATATRYVVYRQVYRGFVSAADPADPIVRDDQLLEIRLVDTGAGDPPPAPTTLWCRTETLIDKKRWLDAFNSGKEASDIYGVWDREQATENPQAKVVFDYSAQQADELSLSVGDTVEVLEHEEEWSKGVVISTGATGWFPAKYVEYTNGDKRLRHLSKTSDA